MHRDSRDPAADNEQLETLRNIVLGPNGQQVTSIVRRDARQLVGEVVVEALHDRQRQEDGLQQVLQPLVETSVERSVTSQRDKMVSALYPIVGSLVRKAVSAFFSDFILRTNELLENSLTMKGLLWRWKARRAGISFAEYAIAQTYQYRVEHLLFVHRETGLLLQSLSLSGAENEQAELISSMLTAINDFVADAFGQREQLEEQQLQKVSTGNFTLLIQSGPSAMLVAAVKGSPPQAITVKMRKTVEKLHQVYTAELSHFNGDNQPFADATRLMQECLLSEEKQSSQKKKRPWLAWTVLFGLLALVISWVVGQWQEARFEKQVWMLDEQPGVVVLHIEARGTEQLTLDILRDPESVDVEEWLQQQNLLPSKLTLKQRAIHSLETPLQFQRLQRVLASYGMLNTTSAEPPWRLKGELDSWQMASLGKDLAQYDLDKARWTDMSAIVVTTAQPLPNKQIQLSILKQLIGEVASYQIGFDIAQTEIDSSMRDTLQQLATTFAQIQSIADSINYKVGLIAQGTSDSRGDEVANLRISQLRAENAAQALVQLGVAAESLYASGMGHPLIPAIEGQSRTVLFNVVYIPNSDE